MSKATSKTPDPLNCPPLNGSTIPQTPVLVEGVLKCPPKEAVKETPVIPQTPTFISTLKSIIPGPAAIDTLKNVLQGTSAEPGIPKGPSQDDINAFIRANTGTNKGPTLWNMFNAIAFLLIIKLILFAIMFGMHQVSNYQKVRENWKYYRCQPSVMPFASFYGHNVAENFQFCLKGIFTGHAMEITAPFSSVLGIFGKILGQIKGTINSITESISTMGGGIMTIFQDFADRIKNFFFQLRLSAIRIKNMVTRMHAIMFSVIYMGMSGIKAGTNFGNTFLFSFLDTFCFPPEIEVIVAQKGTIPIYKVEIGDILLPTNSRVSAKFHFAAQGQPMVQLKGGICVSTNHYILYNGKWIQAGAHPDATPVGPYERQSLICLNTEDHIIPMGPYRFRDYDETAEGDQATLEMIETRLNGKQSANPSLLTENSPTFHPETEVKLYDGSICKVKDLQVTMRLSTGDHITGMIHKEVCEVCQLSKKEIVGSATLVWETHKWIRAGAFCSLMQYDTPVVFIGLITTTSSQIELASGTRVRDYLELCSPDAETFYAEIMNSLEV